MSDIPAELKYAATHEWARLEEDGTVTVGISDHAQSALGDVVYIEGPEIGLNGRCARRGWSGRIGQGWHQIFMRQ